MAKAETKKTWTPSAEEIALFLPVEKVDLAAFKLGDIVRDRHSKFFGPIVVDIRWLNGARRFQISGMDRDGFHKGWVIDDVAVAMIKPAETNCTPIPSGQFSLGDKVKHSFVKDGPKGIITAIHLNQNGCVQYEVCHRYRESLAYILLHEHEMKMVEPIAVSSPVIKRTGAATAEDVTTGRGHMR